MLDYSSGGRNCFLNIVNPGWGIEYSTNGSNVISLKQPLIQNVLHYIGASRSYGVGPIEFSDYKILIYVFGGT